MPGWLVWVALATAAEPERPAETGKGAAAGALEGLAWGAAGGVVLSTFSPWHVHDDLVNIYVHSGVDALIVGVPGAVVGGVIGARQPRSTLRASRLHVGAGFGFTDLLAQKMLKDAYAGSGLAWEAPWWFGRTHWPRGFAVASPYAWSAGGAVRVHPRWQVGAELADTSRQHVAAVDADAASWAGTWTAEAFAEHVVNPVHAGGSRLELAAGAGVGVSRLASGGEIEGEPYEVVRYEPTLPVRATLDWYANPRTSLQARVATRLHTPLHVPEQGVLVGHDVEFTSFDLTVGVRWHLGGV